MDYIDSIPYTLDLFRRPKIRVHLESEFDPKVMSDLKRMTLIKVVAEKTKRGYKHKKVYGFIWGETENRCNKVVCTNGLTYYIDEVQIEEVQLYSKKKRAEIAKISSIKKLRKELLEIIS